MRFRKGILRSLVALVISATAFSCMTAGRSSSTAETLPPCPLETEQSRDWREVTTSLMTFCVPAGWTAQGQNQWQGRGGSIRWSPGLPGAGGRAGLGSAGNAAAGQERRFSEVLGGFPVELWMARMEGGFQTGADWRVPREMHLRGTATSEAAAELQLDVFRTVRPRSESR